jgi:hypothetical protein
VKTELIGNLLGKIIRYALDKELPPPSSKELEYLAEAQFSFRDLERYGAHNAPQCEDEWSENIQQLRKLASSENLRSFLRWNIIRKAMFVGNDLWVIKELRYLKRRMDWNSRWRSAIKESSTGHPPPFIFLRGTSGNLIHHAYHLAKFEEMESAFIHEMDVVIEFGGGYGSMCRLLYQLGFAGTYVLFDIPEFSVLQTYYLRCLGLPVQKTTGLCNSTNGIYCISDLDKFQEVASKRTQIGKSIFVAIWSLSECPLGLREKVKRTVDNVDYYLFGYQEKFGEIQNIEFFQNWRIGHNEIEWHHEKIEHLPGNYYLMGKRQGKILEERRQT